MDFLDLIAEQRIEEALERGELQGLPGEGRPLDLDDDRLVPEELRVAYRVLKNAGFVPPEVEARREAATLRRLLEVATDDDARKRAGARLALIEMRLAARGQSLRASGYYDAVAQRLSGD